MTRDLGKMALGLDKDSKAPADMTDEEIIEAVAKRVVGMQLGVPAIFFLESTKPLSFLGSQLLVFLQPFVQTFLTIRNYERFASLMENRDNVENLILRVEQLDEDLRIDEKRKKAERKKLLAEEKKQPGYKPKSLWRRFLGR
jgi:hypothetical protein